MKNVKNIFGHLVHYWENENNRKVKSLAPPVTSEQIQTLHRELGVTLPRDYIELLKIHNGCDEKSSEYSRFEVGSFYHSDWTFNSSSMVIKTHAHLSNMVEEHGNATAKNNAVAKGIRPVYWDEKWIPIFSDTEGNSICIDFNPSNEGKREQLIYVEYGHSHGRHRIVGPNFLDGFAIIASNLVGSIDGDVPQKKEPEKKSGWGSWLSREELQSKPETKIDFTKSMPIRELWKHWEDYTKEMNPEEIQLLNPPVTSQQLKELESILPKNVRLPSDYLQLLGIHNGSGDKSEEFFTFMGNDFLSTAKILNCHKYMKERAEFYGKQYSRTPNDKPNRVQGIQQVYNDPAWIPLIVSSDWKEFYCVDYNPGPGGAKGQIIEVHFRAGPQRVVGKTFTEFLNAQLSDELDFFYNHDDKETSSYQPPASPPPTSSPRKEEKKPGWLGWLKPKEKK